MKSQIHSSWIYVASFKKFKESLVYFYSSFYICYVNLRILAFIYNQIKERWSKSKALSYVAHGVIKVYTSDQINLLLVVTGEQI